MVAVGASALLLVAALQIASAQQLFEGSNCTSSTGAPGKCRKLTSAECPWALEEVKKNRRPKVCYYAGPYPIVCCPIKTGGAASGVAGPTAGTSAAPPRISTPPKSSAYGRVARAKCNEYAEYVFAEVESVVLMTNTEKQDQCAAAADPLIVGGTQAKAMEFPHMAMIGFDTEDGDIDYRCGGSLISKNFILTAGHCLYSGDKPAQWVLLGELDRGSTKDDARPQVIRVAEIIKHPEYKPPSTYNDIALLRLEKDAVMSGHVRPACLHTEPSLQTRAGGKHDEEVPVATGWGNTEFEGESSNHLMKVAVRVAEHSYCRQVYANTEKKRLQHGIQEQLQLCAGGTQKDTCQGDSGGPLQVSTRNYTQSSTEPYCMYKIVGVTSFGKACGFAPGVYTRVYHYVPWIEGIVWPAAQ